MSTGSGWTTSGHQSCCSAAGTRWRDPPCPPAEVATGMPLSSGHYRCNYSNANYPRPGAHGGCSSTGRSAPRPPACPDCDGTVPRSGPPPPLPLDTSVAMTRPVSTATAVCPRDSAISPLPRLTHDGQWCHRQPPRPGSAVADSLQSDSGTPGMIGGRWEKTI